jgi:hypothetical protein
MENKVEAIAERILVLDNIIEEKNKQIAELSCKLLDL